ncbi:MAG: hypothetical protein KTR35_12970 [Gammaproteobacteria bacterium]|nr:hypothetical protein [Gammaproteobacteria bacterium]
MNTAFLYPIRISLGERDLAWRWMLALHILTALVVVSYLSTILASGVSLFLFISLRWVWDNQSLVRNSDFLIAAHQGMWFLGNDEDPDRQNFVCVESISIISGLLIIRMKRFGHCLYSIQRFDPDIHEEAHKIRLLAVYTP